MCTVRKLRVLALLLFCSLSLVARSSTEAQSSNADAWEALKAGSAIILMRHALAPGTGDPAQFDVNYCSTQRNLSEKGREQALAIGRTLKANGIDSAEVLSSQWCRCLDTGSLLGFGQPKPFPTINSFFQDGSTASDQTQKLSQSITRWIASPEKPVKILVTHQVNISALTGLFAYSGDMLIVTMTNNLPQVLARINTE